MGTLYLVRHGQASFGADNYDVLSPLGHRQAERLGQYLKERGIDFELPSPEHCSVSARRTPAFAGAWAGTCPRWSCLPSTNTTAMH